MRIRIVSYTERGEQTARRIVDALQGTHTAESYARYPKSGDLPLEMSAADWAKDGFQNADALIFVCAAGIAVRAIAPWIQSKTTDPAVLVVDEQARFVIPLLSGHIGGANALALSLSETLGATPVITTATDLNGLFAVDVFAAKNHLHIADMQLAKEISAALLRREPVGFLSMEPIAGDLPDGLTREPAAIGIVVSEQRIEPPYARTLFLTPQRYCIGIGCRRGKDADALSAFVSEQLALANVPDEAVFCLASVDLKADEPGIRALADARSVPFYTYSAQALMAVEGAFSHSAFVAERTGADNVCERAAVLAAGGPLTVHKIAKDGMTFALAKKEEAISFV